MSHDYILFLRIVVKNTETANATGVLLACGQIVRSQGRIQERGPGGLPPASPRRRSRLRRSVWAFAALPGPFFQNSWIRPWE